MEVTKISKVSPVDSISPIILRNHIDIVSTKIEMDFNKAIADGVFPQNMNLAFDIFSLELLIAKLYFYGFDHSSLKLIYDYLSNRFQRVRVDSDFSSCSKILTGVPQGSMFRPDLYNITQMIYFHFSYQIFVILQTTIHLLQLPVIN